MSELRFTSDITVRLVDACGGDHAVVAAARVSTSGEEALAWRDRDADESLGLIRFLMKSRHGGCFEHGLMTFFVQAPVFVFRQLQRHRIASHNEESGRYKELEPVFWLPRRERAMVRADGYKPSRPSFVEATGLVPEFVEFAIKESCQKAWECYQGILQQNIAPEVARAVLPVGIYSSGWFSVNPRALMHFLSLRTRADNARYPSYPQAEIQDAADQMETFFADRFPLTHAAWEECGRVAP